MDICRRYGVPAFARGMKALEILNPLITIEHPTALPIELIGRDLNPFIGAAEAAQLIGQTSRPELMTDRIKKMASYTDDGLFHGAYGSRIAGSLPRVVRLLDADPSTRQAVLSIYSSGLDTSERYSDIPCTLTLQFFVRDGGLCLRVSMRSNDVWLGLPYDLFQFISLQMAVAQSLQLPVGWYCHSVGSMHLYETNERAAAGVRFRRPERLEVVPYPYFGHATIGGISQRMRRLLDDPSRYDLDLTRFEAMIAKGLQS